MANLVTIQVMKDSYKIDKDLYCELKLIDYKQINPFSHKYRL